MNSVNQLLALLPEGGWQRLMCDALWQSALIAALGCLIARFFARHAAPRAWVLLLTATACIIVPLASAASRDAGWTLLARVESAAIGEERENGRKGEGEMIVAERPLNLSPAMEVAPIEPQQSLTAPHAAEPETTAAATTAPILYFSPAPILSPSASPVLELNWLHTLALAWLTASALLALRLVFSALAVRKILRRAKPCEDTRLLSAAAEAAARVGLAKAPPVYVSDRIESPMVLALTKPCLLVPHGGEENVAEVNWTAAFTHELAHVARRDGWSRLWMELVAICLPLQPLVWLVRRNFHLACEEACDDWSVAAGSDPVDLAETLTAWLGRRTPRPATAIGMSSTKARVLRLLAMREKPIANVPRVWRCAGLSAVLLLIAGLAVAQVPTKPHQSPTPPQPPKVDAKDAEDEEQLIDGELDTHPSIVGLNKQISDFYNSLGLASSSAKSPARDSAVRKLQRQIADLEQQFEQLREKLRPKILENLRAKRNRTSAQNRVPPSEKAMISLPPYTIEPPDVLLVELQNAVPREPMRIAPFDKIRIETSETGNPPPVGGEFKVDSTGRVILNPGYGAAKVQGLTRAEAEAAVTKHLREIFKNPQVALTIDESRLTKGIAGEHLVAPDGEVNLGTFGSVYVSGMTVPEATAAIEKKLAEHFESIKVAVDVFAYNSKVYYVIVQAAEAKDGDNIYRFPITGNETVLDAISQVKGLSQVASKNIWIARPSPNGQDQTLLVKWDEIVAGGGTNTNYQILPGDRVFVAGSATKRDIRFAPGKIRVELLDRDDPNTWRWKLFIPKGVRYGWKIAYDDIPKLTPPPEGTSHIMSGYSNEPYYATSNEVLVTAKLLKLENGNWRMSVSSRINSESGEPTWQMSGVSAEIPAESLKWRGTVGSTDGQTLGNHGNVLVDASDQIILLQSRPCQRQPDGTYLPAEGTAPGFMVWMEKWGEERSPSVPQTAPPAKTTIPPQGSVLTQPETAPSDGWVPNALWPRPSMPNALDSNSPYRRSQSALKDTAKPALPLPYPQSPYYTATPPQSFQSAPRQPSYSVIVKNVPGRKDSVERFQYKGDETVLEAISQIQDLTKLTGVFIWILRPAENPSQDDETIDVDWDKISGKTDGKSPPKLLAGDRVFITGGRPVTTPAPADTKKKADGDSNQSPSASQFPTY